MPRTPSGGGSRGGTLPVSGPSCEWNTEKSENANASFEAGVGGTFWPQRSANFSVLRASNVDVGDVAST